MKEKATHGQEGSHLAWYCVLGLLHRLQPKVRRHGVLLTREHDRRHCSGLRHVLHQPRRLASGVWALTSHAAVLPRTTRHSDTTIRPSMRVRSTRRAPPIRTDRATDRKSVV